VDPKKYKGPSLVDFPMLQEFEDVFPKEVIGLPPKCGIDFSIDRMPKFS
jgi:hypothetical protein